MERPLIDTREIVKEYATGAIRVRALKGVTLGITRGEFVTIMGPSGSGKSTLMNILGCLDRPTGGQYWLGSQLVADKVDNELAEIRNRMIGFVFQGYNLLPRLTALHNVELPLIYSGASARERRRKAAEALDLVGLADRMRHRPSELSGGQQQRVAIARALATEPALILADEPTGNLDTVSSRDIMTLFQRLNGELQVTIVQVTHDPAMASYTQRLIQLLDGEVVKDGEPVETG